MCYQCLMQKLTAFSVLVGMISFFGCGGPAEHGTTRTYSGDLFELEEIPIQTPYSPQILSYEHRSDCVNTSSSICPGFFYFSWNERICNIRGVGRFRFSLGDGRISINCHDYRGLVSVEPGTYNLRVEQINPFGELQRTWTVQGIVVISNQTENYSFSSE